MLIPSNYHSTCLITHITPQNNYILKPKTSLVDGFPMTTPSPLSIPTSTNTCHKIPTCCLLPKPTNLYYLRSSKYGFLHKSRIKMKLWSYREKGCLHECRIGKDGIALWGEEKLSKKKKRVVLVRFNNRGFNFNGSGGGGRDGGTDVRVLGNLALAVGLTYFTMTGQLGWLLDTIVSLWLLSIVIPIAGFAAFLWWARQDMIQSTCPNCGNGFQVFKSSLNDELQLCPYCSQPFSVEGNEFVKEPITFSNRSTASGQTFDDFSPWSKKGKETSKAIVDVEAEVKDIE